MVSLKESIVENPACKSALHQWLDENGMTDLSLNDNVYIMKRPLWKTITYFFAI